MTPFGRLMLDMFGRQRDRAVHKEQTRTNDLIHEAERTRRELHRLTNRLAAHVIALKAITAAYARENQEGIGGRAKAPDASA